MTTVLQLNTSIFGDDGQSSRLADDLVARWQAREPDLRVIRRDLAEAPLPHLTAERFQAALTPPGDRTPEQTREAAIADELITELKAADILVIGSPMYNFSIPSTLKAWFDHVARAGTTFKYTANGPVGLLKNKHVYVFTTRGGLYAGTEKDVQTPLIRQFLGLLGIERVEFVYAEGLAMGEESGRQALQEASDRIETLAA